LKSVKVAIVGAGYTAREHAKAFQSIGGVTLAGIHSRTRARAEALATELGIERVFDSIDELYEQTRADLVVVTVVELSMNAVAKAVFRHPWTVLLEKPAGVDLADAEDIANAARPRGRVYVALNRRMYASTAAALDALRTNGQPRFVHVQDQQDQAAALAAGQPAEVVRNWMFANSVHVVDYLRLFGRGVVTGVQRIVPYQPDNPGVVVAKVDFASGDAGLYEGIWNGPGPWAASISTPAERWELRPLESARVQKRGERRQQEMPADELDQQFKPGFRRQAEAAVAAARGEETILATIDDALQTMRLVSAIFQ